METKKLRGQMKRFTSYSVAQSSVGVETGCEVSCDMPRCKYVRRALGGSTWHLSTEPGLCETACMKRLTAV